MNKFIETVDSITRISDIIHVNKDIVTEKNSLGAVVKTWYVVVVWLMHTEKTITYRYCSETLRDKNYNLIVAQLKKEEDNNEQAEKTIRNDTI